MLQLNRALFRGCGQGLDLLLLGRPRFQLPRSKRSGVESVFLGVSSLPEGIGAERLDAHSLEYPNLS